MLVVNDASTVSQPKLIKPNKIKSLQDFKHEKK